MLVNSNQILHQARESNYAVPAPDYIDADSARVFVHVAQELNKPLILSYAQAFEDFFPLEEAAVIGTYLAKKVKVPIALHLDHGTSLEMAERAIACGFTSVMIDASAETFDVNVARTAEVVRFAHAHNVTVEAEIGHVGQGDNYSSWSHSDSIYTTVEEAAAFAEQTGVDSLAVSIGTVHGIYKNLEKPKLNFERLHELSQNVSIPLVLHGGSGTGDENLHRCATEGISKINIYTDFLTGAMQRINAEHANNYLAVKNAANLGMADVLRHYYSIFEKD